MGQGWSKHLPCVETRDRGQYGTPPLVFRRRARDGHGPNTPSHRNTRRRGIRHLSISCFKRGRDRGGSENIPPHQNTRRRGIQQPSVSHFERGRGTGWWQSRTPPPSHVWSEEGPSCILMRGRAGGGRNASRRVDGR